jgi:hypothetical protein
MTAESFDLSQTGRGRDVLVVPAGTDVLHLARAWFPDAVRTRRAALRVAAPPTGARFRGVPTQAEAPGEGTGVIRLDALTDLHGPRTLTAADAAAAGYRTAGVVDAYELSAATGGRAVDARAWLVAAARRAGGVVVPADGSGAFAPDGGALVDLALWSAVPLSADEAVPLLRPALTGGRLGDVRVGHVTAGPSPFELEAHFEYDGVLTVGMSRPSEAPPVLGSLDWREHGPWQYRVGWSSPHGDELVDGSSPLLAIARGRMRPTIARVALELWNLAGGTVLDAGGFVVGREELLDRASRR